MAITSTGYGELDDQDRSSRAVSDNNPQKIRESTEDVTGGSYSGASVTQPEPAAAMWC
jgi:hypothetical protein